MAGDASWYDHGVHPKVQMIMGSDAATNVARAQMSGNVAITKELAVQLDPRLFEAVSRHQEEGWDPRRQEQAPLREIAEEPAPTREPPSTEDTERGTYYSFFGELGEGVSRVASEAAGLSFQETDEGKRGTLTSREGLRRLLARNRLRTFEATRPEAAKLKHEGLLASYELALELRRPWAAIGAAHATLPEPEASPLVTEAANAEGDGAEGVLIGIIDVGGFDFAHPDFLKTDDSGETSTRFLAIWDQGGQLRGHPRGPRKPGEPTPPELFDYGAEILQEQLKAALAGQAKHGVPAWRLEPQSTMQPDSHGTHVASIAAGKHTACRDADIVAVLVDVPELAKRRCSLYDTSRLVHAVEYLVAWAEALKRPLAINISLATNGHAHDASCAGSRWLDALLTVPGRAICVAAGNAGQEEPRHPEDLGWMMGRIHSQGRIPAEGLFHDLEWLVVGDGVEDVSENELEIWTSGQDRLSVQLRTPDGRWLDPVEPRGRLEHLEHDYEVEDPSTGAAAKRRCRVSVYNTVCSPANGANHIAVYLSPDVGNDPKGPQAIEGVQPGCWLVRLKGETIRDGRFHAWIERDDPGPAIHHGGRVLRRYPSFFSRQSNVAAASVNSLACGPRLIAVANLDAAEDRVFPSSSRGPTRDDRPKPDVAAPGTGVVAARGFEDRTERWVAMTGTSMASPAVCGLVARMLAVNPTLTAAQIGSILRSTAQPLPGRDYSWQQDAGFGIVQPKLALEEARLAKPGAGSGPGVTS